MGVGGDDEGVLHGAASTTMASSVSATTELLSVSAPTKAWSVSGATKASNVSTDINASCESAATQAFGVSAATEASSESAATNASSVSTTCIVKDGCPPPGGAIHFSHTSKRPIFIDDEDFEIGCPPCCFDLGEAERDSKLDQSLNIVLKGLHVEKGRAMENSKFKPFKKPLKEASNAELEGQSIRPRGPPSYDIDVICPHCAYCLGAVPAHSGPSVAAFNKIIIGEHLHE